MAQLFFIFLFFMTIFNVYGRETDSINAIIDSKNRRELQLHYVNNQKYDIFCPDINVFIEFCDRNFCDIVGSTLTGVNNAYIPRQSQRLFTIESPTRMIIRYYPNAIIRNIKYIENASCSRADFSSYCKYAKKSKEEKRTLGVVQKILKRDGCDIDGESIVSLKLKEQGPKDIRPLSYLTGLERLEISDSSIVDFSPLQDLKKLWKFTLKNNQTPVNLEDLFKINGIARIYLDNISFLKMPSSFPHSLKVLRIKKSPDLCQKYEDIRKKTSFNFECE